MASGVQGVSGTAVAAAAAGGLLVWSGLKGASISQSLRSVLSGQKPSGAVANPITGTSPATAAASALTGVVAGLGGYSHAQLQTLWQQAGGSAAAANNAACHAVQESGGNPAATSSNPDGGTNAGLWQLDTRGVGAGYTVAQLKNPLLNARLTVQATGNGADWSQWATPGC